MADETAKNTPTVLKDKDEILDQAMDPKGSSKPVVEVPLLSAGMTVPEGYVAVVLPLIVPWEVTKPSASGKTFGITARMPQSAFVPVKLTGTKHGDLDGIFGFGATNVNITFRTRPKNLKG